MVKFYVKLDKDQSTIEVSAQRGRKILGVSKDIYDKDLADKMIQGIGKSLEFAGINKKERARAYLKSESPSFVTSIIAKSVVDVFNWIEKKR